MNGHLADGHDADFRGHDADGHDADRAADILPISLISQARGRFADTDDFADILPTDMMPTVADIMPKAVCIDGHFADMRFWCEIEQDRIRTGPPVRDYFGSDMLTYASRGRNCAPI